MTVHRGGQTAPSGPELGARLRLDVSAKHYQGWNSVGDDDDAAERSARGRSPRETWETRPR